MDETTDDCAQDVKLHNGANCCYSCSYKFRNINDGFYKYGEMMKYIKQVISLNDEKYC